MASERGQRRGGWRRPGRWCRRVNEDDSVELAFELEQNDRGVDLTLQQLGGEVLLQSAAVDGPLAVTRNQTDTGDSSLRRPVP